MVKYNALPGFKSVDELKEALAYFTSSDEEKDYQTELEKKKRAKELFQ